MDRVMNWEMALTDNNFPLYLYPFVCPEIRENNLPFKPDKQYIEIGLLTAGPGYEYYFKEL